MSFVDSISIKFLNPSLIIYGRGNRLILQHGKMKEIFGLKTYDKIHKISFTVENNNAYKIACAAGREILLTEVRENKFFGGFVTKFNDWISSIKYLENGIAIITSHNIAALLAVEEKSNKLVMIDKVKCHDNSTLYCSFIYGTVWSDLLFFSGTALGELIIWRKHLSNDSETIYQKSTHNGVIFTIAYNGNYIVTGSDDRSIKIYQVAKNLSEITPIKQLFGHTSRVFVGKIIEYENEIKFVSAGEDSNICIWTENGSLQAKKNINASGGIWDLDYDAMKGIIITSSSTGKLNKFHLEKIFYESHEKEVISTKEHIEPSKLLYLQNGTLCVLDSNMQIHIKTTHWQKVDQPTNPQKIVSMDTYDNRLFLAAKNSVLIFDYSSSCHTLNFTSELNTDDEKFSSLPQKLNYFRAIHVLNRNEIFLSDVFGSCMVVDVENGIVKNLFRIPKSSEPWTTSVAKIDDYWIIADRVGSIFLYQDKHDLNTFLLPIQKLSKLHGQTGVTTINVEIENDFVKTAGNDGTIKTLRLNRQTSQLEFYQLERTTHVHFIEKIREYNGQKYVHGFNDNYFVMYKGREIIYEHKCGGRHRHWDVALINKDDCKMQFTYIYKKQVHCVEFYLSDFIFDDISCGISSDDNVFWHTKQCNVLKVIDDMKILISGGEDTFLKLTKIDVPKTQEKETNDVWMRKIADINSHISSIKAIVTWTERNEMNGGDDLCIISMGGRAQIVMTRVIGMKYVKEEINFMLTNSMLCGNSKDSTFDPETRFTCAFFDVKKKHLFVGCSDGYLRVFQLIQNEFSSSLKPITESFYGRCILHITMIKSFILTMATDGNVCFWYFKNILKATKPQQQHQYEQREIGVESNKMDAEQEKNINDEIYLSIAHKLQHNQNGINCFDVLAIGADRYKIATSGDDSGIFVTEFEIIDNSVIKCHKTIKTYEIHTAQVTGIKFMSNDELLTTSVDQTLCKVIIKSDKFEIADKRFTCISDVKGFSLLDKDFVFIHGAGIETIKYF